MTALPLASLPRVNVRALQDAKAVLAQAERQTGALKAELDDQFIPVVQALAAALPYGLRRGNTVTVLGAASLAMSLIAEASGRGAWAAIVGLPEWGVTAAAELGVVSERTALIPTPGVTAAAVIAAALDGIDLVLVGPRVIRTLTLGEQRRIDNRVRERGAVLIACAPWESSRTVITATRLNWTGVGRGDGHLRQRSYHVAAHGRGIPGHSRELRLDLPLVGIDSAEIRRSALIGSRKHDASFSERHVATSWAARR